MSNFIGPELTDILASLAAIGSLIVLFKLWQPKDTFVLAGEHMAQATRGPGSSGGRTVDVGPRHHSSGEVFMAWAPYLLLVIFVLLWAAKPVKAVLDAQSLAFGWPGLHNMIQQMPPVVKAAAPYGAPYKFNWLSAPGTACLFAAILSAMLLGMSAGAVRTRFHRDGKTDGAAGGDHRLGAGSGLPDELFRSDSHAGSGLFRDRCHVPVLQRAARLAGSFPDRQRHVRQCAVRKPAGDDRRRSLHLNPVLMAASNSSGGVMGKMISLPSVAVAAAATGMAAGRIEAVPLHAEAQHPAGHGAGSNRDGVRVRSAAVRAINAHRDEMSRPMEEA